MKEYKRQCKLMGSAFELLVIHHHKRQALQLLQEGIDEIKRLEIMLSEFLEDSVTSKINRKAHQSPLRINEECFKLIERSLSISRLTQGCFDISMAPLKKLYAFKNADFEMPSLSQIQQYLDKVGFQKIHLNKKEQSIYFTQKDMKISFAAIGKGYASDCVKKLWLKKGVHAGYINASGDLTAFGTKTDGSNWNIGIANPENPKEMLLYIPMAQASVATSGDYEQYFIHHGKRYSHNINPITGLPLSGILSVSVVSPSAELSDALATAVYVMGKESGIEFINQLPQTHAIFIDDQHQIHFSKQMRYEEAHL